MKIEILGVGCSKCKQLTANAEAAVKELDIEAEINKVTDIDKITEYGVMMTPALVIDGKIISSGKLLGKDEIKKLIAPYGVTETGLMKKRRVLFVCVHNAARSQMAEAFLKKYGGDRFEAESAGLEPGVLNPLVVEVMQEVGIDISRNKTKSVFDFYRQGREYDVVVTVCDESRAGACPVFPGPAERLHWSFDDPSRFEGSREEKREKARGVRDKIKQKIIAWLEEAGGNPLK